MVIDFHTHCFPDKLAERALGTLSFNSGGLEIYSDGTLSGLKKSMDENGVDISVVMNIATNEHQQTSVNDFAAKINEGNIVSFGSVHPFAANVMDELERIKELGLKGVKFHPEFQQFYADDEKMKPIYKKISELGLITLFHAGHDVGFDFPYHCLPEHLVKALKWFDSPVVAAHWGGFACYEDVYNKLCTLPIYFDTSFGYGVIPKPVAKKIIEKHGIDNILFGSDSPWHSPVMDKKLIDTLELDEESYDKIMWKNAANLLGIQI